ncbi:MAG TPA: porin, partial [Aquabacterium sp.]|nr:porin [Aquabacterium sp.]
MLALFSPLSALSSARAGTSRQPLHCLSLISLALACGSAAQAQSSSGVELFGRLDLGMVAFKGIQAKTTTVLGSGMSHGSFLGVRGEEDLGQGYKAVFVMEHGLHADSGDTNQPEPLSGRRVPEYATRGLPDEIAPVMQAALGDFLIEKTKQPFWGRQALLGLITPVGAVLGGRLYTPAYEIFDRY